jgi:prevent-host-death family protein
MKKKSYSIMASQHNLSKVLREVAAGYQVEITRRKVPVARLTAIEDEGRIVLPDFAARARGVWGSAWKGRSSSALLQESRGDR